MLFKKTTQAQENTKKKDPLKQISSRITKQEETAIRSKAIAEKTDVKNNEKSIRITKNGEGQMHVNEMERFL